MAELPDCVDLTESWASHGLDGPVGSALAAQVDLARFAVGESGSLRRAYDIARTNTTPVAGGRDLAGGRGLAGGNPQEKIRAALQADGIPEPDPGVCADLALRVAALQGTLPGPVDEVALPLLFSFGVHGEVGAVRLHRLASGAPDLYPDPRTMGLTVCDARFLDALRSAWTARPLDNATVLWSVSDGKGYPDWLEGDSAGATIALALDELGRRTTRWARARPRRASEKVAISAALGHDATLRRVDDIKAKIDAASVAGKKAVVLPAANRGDTEHQQGRSAVPLKYATDLDEAFRHARRCRPVFLRSVGVLSVLAVLAAMLVIQHMNDVQRKHQAALVDKARSLLATAKTTDANSTASQQTQAILLLTAHALAAEGGNTDLANSIPCRPSSTTCTPRCPGCSGRSTPTPWCWRAC
ncbi:hypothetical protein [Streptomyces sp. NPDC046197]|uniref:hypothetical protein n=1 Tax=Streptomyces sp. NPDC046197 TaxID=3154337 RepID=UPI0033EEC1E6